jgi:hypothetical protein
MIGAILARERLADIVPLAVCSSRGALPLELPNHANTMSYAIDPAARREAKRLFRAQGGLAVRLSRLAVSLSTAACLGCATTPRPAPPGDQAVCHDMDPDSSSPARDGAKPFDVAKDEDFSRYEAALGDYVAHNVPARQADFCIIGFAHGEDWRTAWVLWPEGDRVLEWGGGEPDMAAPQQINLKTDVVSSEREIRGSTYLVTQQWVDRLRKACACLGRKVHIAIVASDRNDARADNLPGKNTDIHE